MIFKSRRTAYNIMQEFEDLLFDLVKNRPKKLGRKEPLAPQDELLVHMLERAFEEGRIDEQQFRDNLKITFLTAHENTQQLLSSTFWQLGVNQVRIHQSLAIYPFLYFHNPRSLQLTPSLQAIQDGLRAEVLATGVSDPTSETLNALPYLTAIIVELLRVYPPVSQLINRVTTRDASLGGTIQIPKGTFVGWNAPGVQSDPKVWGPTARQFIPERWGTSPKEIMDKVRKETVKGHMISFNSHSRKCLGQGYALLEMKMVLFELVRRVKWTVSPDYELKLTSVRATFLTFSLKMYSMTNAISGRNSSTIRLQSTDPRTGTA